jgi:hypothetical protein
VREKLMARSLGWMHKMAAYMLIAVGLILYSSCDAKASNISKELIDYLSKRAIVDYSETIVDWHSYDKSKFIALSGFLKVGMNSSAIHSTLNYGHYISIDFSDIKRDDMIDLLKLCPDTMENCIAIVSGNVDRSKHSPNWRIIKAVLVQYCVITKDGVCHMDYVAIAK